MTQIPTLAESVAGLRHEMARGGDYAVVDIAWLRSVLDVLDTYPILKVSTENERLWRLVREVRLNETCQEDQPDWMARIDALEAQAASSSQPSTT